MLIVFFTSYYWAWYLVGECVFECVQEVKLLSMSIPQKIQNLKNRQTYRGGNEYGGRGGKLGTRIKADKCKLCHIRIAHSNSVIFSQVSA